MDLYTSDFELPYYSLGIVSHQEILPTPNENINIFQRKLENDVKKEYSIYIDRAKNIIISELQMKARKLRADEIISVRFEIKHLNSSYFVVLGYGTAIKRKQLFYNNEMAEINDQDNNDNALISKEQKEDVPPVLDTIISDEIENNKEDTVRSLSDDTEISFQPIPRSQTRSILYKRARELQIQNEYDDSTNDEK